MPNVAASQHGTRVRLSEQHSPARADYLSETSTRPRAPVTIVRYVGTLGLLALTYYLTGRLGLLLAVPPGYATAIWPPSGVALAAILVLGYRYWPGVWLGSFAVNLFTSFDPSNSASMFTSGGIAALIAAGAAVQAVSGAWLCRRWIVFPNALERGRDIGLLLALGGAAACLINSFTGTAVLTAVGLVSPDKAPLSWLTWWVGDTIGVLVFTPIALLVGNAADLVSARRKKVVSIALVATFAAAVAVFVAARNWDQERRQLAFEKRASLVTAHLRGQMNDYLSAIDSVTRLYATSEEVTRETFTTFGAGIMALHPGGMKGLTWTPKVTDSGRSDFEERVRRQGLPEFRISDRDGQYRPIPAERRDVYYPVLYMEPHVEKLLGFDDNSEAIRRQTLEAARDSGDRRATARLNILRVAKDDYGTLIFEPVYANGKPSQTVEERRRNIKGFVVGAFVLPDFVAASLRNVEYRDLDIYITDDSSAPQTRLLYDSRTANHKESSTTSAPGSGEMFWQTRLDVAGRTWTIHCTPGRGAAAADQSWGVFLVLAGGLLFASLSGAFVMTVTARTDVVRRLVNERTRQLTESEERRQQLVDGVQDYAIYWLDLQGNVESWNSGAERIEGYTAREIIGEHFSKFYTPEDRARGLPQKALATALVQGRFESEGWRMRKSGATFWASVTIARLRDRRGEAAGFVEVTRDISERRRFEQELKTSEETFRLAMEHASIGMALVAPEGHWIKVNAALCELIGYGEDELTRTDFQAITHPEDLATDLQYVRQMLDGAIQTYQMEKRYRHKDGHIILTLLSVSLVRHPDGTPKYFVSQIQDITQRKEMDRLKSEFIATVSHELRTPLTSIAGAVGLLSGGVAGQLPTQAMELLRIAEQNSQRLVRLINDILDIEKVAAGKMEFQLEAHPLEPLVRQSIEANRAYAAGLGVGIAMTSQAAGACVRVDRDRLHQVLTNLLSNAAKFSPPGSDVHVEISLDRNMARIAVRDRGPGIAEEFRGRIFEKFAQADGSDARRQSGTGLGLSIAKALIEGLGGAIEYQTALGAGTTFFVTLPLYGSAGSH
jgi:PAS domain S-box-containing protein